MRLRVHTFDLPLRHVFTISRESISVQPTVIVGKESYPMRPVKYMRNRWECLVPVPAGENSVSYHYKFDYQFNDFGGPRKGSASSHSFKLQIVDAPQ